MANDRRYTRAPLRLRFASGVTRLHIMLVALAIVVSVCAGRLVQLQVFDSQAYAATAEAQMTRSVPLPAERGVITDRNGVTLAVSQPAMDITCDPSITSKDADEIATLMVAHIGGDAATYKKVLTKPDTRFAYVARKVPAAQYDRLAADLAKAGIYGVFRESSPIRTYPEGTNSAAVVGFLNGKNEGVAGVELMLNDELDGTSGEEVFEASPSGQRIPLGQNVVTPAQDGVSYELTLDTRIQAISERKLADQVRKHNADSGVAITMDIKTGEIIAMANVPTFDANDIAAADSEDLFNRSITQAYEPGSVQKILTMAALTDAGVVAPQTRLVVPPSIQSGGGQVKDVWQHGYAQVTARGAFAYSSNIGMIMMAREMPTEQYHQYMADFGLGRPTGIELPGEAAGSLPPADMPDYTKDQMAFGQGLSVTTLQETAAIAGVLNDGVYNQPTIIRRATDAAGNDVPIERAQPRRVVSKESSRMVASMMESVTAPGGFGTRVAMEDYRTGGKTGTAEKFDPELGKYHGYTASYVGMAPAEDPQYITFVAVDNPRNGHTGSEAAAPVYYDTMRAVLSSYGVPPSTTEGPTEDMLTW